MRRLLPLLLLFGCEKTTDETPVDTPPSSACESAAAAAQTALDTYCGACHAQANEGGMDYVLDAIKLAERGKIVPGDPTASRLLTRVQAGEMPPPYGDPAPPTPDAASVSAIETWIACGAPAFDALASRPFLSPSQVLVLVDEDLQQFHEEDRLFQRYLSIAPLYNAGRPDGELARARDALAKLLNSLSWASEVARPADVHEALLRIDLRDYLWSSVDRLPFGLQPQDVWELLVERDPYGTTEGGPLFAALVEQTGTSMPILRADWFTAVAAVPPAYHEILQIPTTDESLEWRLGIAVAANLNGHSPRAVRAGFRDSGVSNNNRMIERHPSPLGFGFAYWKSYDFAPVDDEEDGQRRNLFDHPLGPGPDLRDFKHDGGEIIFSLPNGLQAYMLVDAAGERIDRGPIEIVRDNRRPDASVVNGLSCMSCHANGMIEKADEIRGHVDSSAAGFSNAERAAVEALYPEIDAFNRLLHADRDRFLDRLHALDIATDADEPIAAFNESFEAELDLPRAAAELGLTRQALTAALAVNPDLERTFGSLTTVGVERDVFQRNFRVLACRLRPETCGVLPQPTRRPQRPSTACPGLDEADGRCNGCPANVDVPDGHVCLPAGVFAMGSAAEEPGHNPGEARRRITLPQPLLMMKTPVTRARARDFGLFTECGRDCPIESLTWYEAVALANAFSAEEGLAPCYLRPGGDPYEEASARLFETPVWRRDCDGYRLPTEAEWEYAARAGTTSAVYTGDITVLGESDAPELDGIAWYAGNSGVSYDGYTVDCAFWPEVQRRYEQCGIQPTGLKTPNRWGLSDMIGNVSEWCWDWYAPVPEEGPQAAPEGPEIGSNKVVRGGGWYHVATSNRAAARGYHDPSEGSDWLGVRFVRSAPIVGAP